jgi:hypothetical protein
VAIVGRASAGDPVPNDSEIAEISVMPIENEWRPDELSYPFTNYGRYINLMEQHTFLANQLRLSRHV